MNCPHHQAPKVLRLAALYLGCLSASACSKDDAPPPPVFMQDAGTATPDSGQDIPDSGINPDAAINPDAGTTPFSWPVPTSSISITPSPFWKNTITRDDEFLDEPQNGESIRWVKFAVLMRDPSKVYYQDSKAYPFHYEFATERLDPFLNLSRDQFNEQSLHKSGQEIILGAVLFSPKSQTAEYGVQLVRQDSYHPQMVRIVFDLVRSSVSVSTQTKAFYFPTYEQAASAETNSEFFAIHNIPVSSTGRWAKGHVCYSSGWGLGRLRQIDASDIDAAYADGRLTYQDILLTNGVPAEIPLVAGVITLTPSTPNSHVAILAKSYGIPFIHLTKEPELSQVDALIDRDILFEAQSDWSGYCQVKLLDLEGKIASSMREEILELKAAPQLEITPKSTLGVISESTGRLDQSSIQYFGGKASNFSFLRASIPNNSPEAIAFSFDLWDGFMSQEIAPGTTLGQEISTRLNAHQWPPNIAQLRSDLDEVRRIIKEDTNFTTEQSTAIEAALSGFEPTKKIRFRSSTNVEDSDQFVGAGLYDSYSGCLADDEDADTAGPSLCDPSRMKERGVYRAIRKVYASFYNENAYIERLRHRIDESQVGMGILVHHSFPDPQEQANGVAIIKRNRFNTEFELVSQIGANSVANPENGATPEMVRGFFNGSYHFTQQTSSSLVPLGATVMDFEDDYLALTMLLVAVSDHYAQTTGQEDFTLDLEYKKMENLGLLIKQVRKVPKPPNSANITPFLVNDPVTLCTFQGEYEDVMAVHRLKSRWDLTTNNIRMTEAQLTQSIFGDLNFEYLTGAQTNTLSGQPSSWADARHEHRNSEVSDSWRIGDRHYTLKAAFTPLVQPSKSPVFTLNELNLFLEVDYDNPVPFLEWTGMSATRTREAIRLGRCPENNTLVDGVIRRQHDVTLSNNRRIEIEHYWPPAPTGIIAGYTAPLHQWVETRLSGFTAQPILLRGYYSQSYRPGHHNFTEAFVFEPRLESGLDPSVIAELNAQDIKLIHIRVGSDEAVKIMGLDGVFRDLE